MNLFRKVLVGVLGLALCHAGPEARAGDGFPPNGAWAYGSRPYGQVARGHVRHVGHVRSVGWGNYGLGHYGGFGHYGLGYGGLGYGGYRSVHYRSYSSGWYGHRGHYRSVVRGFGPAWNWHGPSFYSSYRTGYYFPSHPLYTCGLPVYSSFYVAPTVNFMVAPYCDAVITQPASLYFSAGLPTRATLDDSQVQLTDYSTYGVGDYSPVAAASNVAVVPYRAAKPSLVPPLRRDDSLEVPVQLVSQTQESPLIPEAILGAADDIFRAGGYREAATAYAQLAVRYGSSELLYTRRFVAQVASGDVEQAIVVALTAEMAGVQINRGTLPGGSLSGLGLDDAVVSVRKEALAEHAFRLAEDGDALFAVAGWLHLANDDERAGVFLTRARQLMNATETPKTATPKNEPKIM